MYFRARLCVLHLNLKHFVKRLLGLISHETTLTECSCPGYMKEEGGCGNLFDVLLYHCEFIIWM